MADALLERETLGFQEIEDIMNGIALAPFDPKIHQQSPKSPAEQEVAAKEAAGEGAVFPIPNKKVTQA